MTKTRFTNGKNLILFAWMASKTFQKFIRAVLYYFKKIEKGYIGPMFHFLPVYLEEIDN